MDTKLKYPLLAFASMSLLAGCATSQPPHSQTALDASVLEQTQALDARSEVLNQRENDLTRSEAELATQRGEVELAAKNSAVLAQGTDLLPPDAKAGECYARVWVEPVFNNVSQTVLVKEASEKIHTVPARYETVTEEVLVKEADYKIKTAQATYKTVSEQKKVSDAALLWKIDLAKTAPPASDELLLAAKNAGIDLDSAEPGMCFHEHYMPAEYSYEDETVLVKEAYDTLSIDEPEYRWVEKQVLVKEEATVLKSSPAVYETKTEQVVDVAAHTIWKKGTGPVQKIDEATGEIMCLVEVPATYKTVTSRILSSVARTEQVTIPAEYKTVKVRELVKGAQEVRTEVPATYSTVRVEKKVSDVDFVWHEIHNMHHPKQTRTGNKICLTEKPAVYKTVTSTVVDTPASTQRVEIPAVYKTVNVTKLVEDAHETREQVSAEYTDVVSQELEQEGFMEWRSILCKTNMTTSTISDIQRALLGKDYNPGPIDGVIGSETMSAVNAFQSDNSLPTDKYINMETIEALGVDL